MMLQCANKGSKSLRHTQGCNQSIMPQNSTCWVDTVKIDQLFSATRAHFSASFTLKQYMSASRDYSCVPFFASLLATLGGDLPWLFWISQVAAPIHWDQYLLALATCYRSDAHSWVQLPWSPFFPDNLTVDPSDPSRPPPVSLLPRFHEKALLLAFTRTYFGSLMLLPRIPSPVWWVLTCTTIRSINVWTELVALGPPSDVSPAKCGWTPRLSIHFHGPVHYNSGSQMRPESSKLPAQVTW
jgi:hypothetical protein